MAGIRISPTGLPSGGASVRGAVTGGPEGKVFGAPAASRAWTTFVWWVSDVSCLRNWFWECDSWMEVPQSW